MSDYKKKGVYTQDIPADVIFRMSQIEQIISYVLSSSKSSFLLALILEIPFSIPSIIIRNPQIKAVMVNIYSVL